MKSIFLKKALLITSLVVSLALFTGCSTQTPQATATPVAATATVVATATTTQTTAPTTTATSTPVPTVAAVATSLPTLNATQLAQYNGQNGNPAYIAVNGNVYDVTDVPQWKNGSHFGRYTAGVDLTDQLKFSPHGASKLDGVPIVGTYVQ